MHYLGEVRLDAAWLRQDGDQTVVLSPDRFRLHPGRKTVEASSADAASAALGGAVMAFVPDSAADGSFDLFLGSYWRRPSTSARLICDFVPARR